jgi:hypothetical protein
MPHAISSAVTCLKKKKRKKKKEKKNWKSRIQLPLQSASFILDI